MTIFLQREKKINLPQVSDYFKIVFLCSSSEVAIYINPKCGFELLWKNAHCCVHLIDYPCVSMLSHARSFTPSCI